MKLKRCLFLFSLLVCNRLPAQNLTGTWEGKGGGEYLKMVIIQFGDSCFGYTYDTGLGFCKANFGGRYNDSTNVLKGKGIDFIDRTMLHVLCSYELSYDSFDGKEFLRGKLKPKAKILSFGIAEPVQLKKISNDIDTTKLIAEKIAFYQNKELVSKYSDSGLVKITGIIKVTEVVKDTVALRTAPDLTVLKQSRKSKIVETIETAADSIQLILFDNGEIDGDTVTVFYNGAIIISNLGLSATAFEMKVPVNKVNPENSIELMANNLGSIPPNTAHMHIIAGKNKYELRVSSDFNENAKINIIYKKE